MEDYWTARLSAFDCGIWCILSALIAEHWVWKCNSGEGGGVALCCLACLRDECTCDSFGLFKWAGLLLIWCMRLKKKRTSEFSFLSCSTTVALAKFLIQELYRPDHTIVFPSADENFRTVSKTKSQNNQHLPI